MEHLGQVTSICVAALAVAIADVLIKKVGTTVVSVWEAIVHPLMLAALFFYIVQIVLFSYVFVHRWDLGVVALLQMGFYAAACLLIGRFYFGERIGLTQGLGMCLTFCGVVLMRQ
jgi:hypothetical protein